MFCTGEQMLRQQWPHLHKSAKSAICEFEPTQVLLLQRTTGMWAAAAASKAGTECLLWAAPGASCNADPIDAALALTAAVSPHC